MMFEKVSDTDVSEMQYSTIHNLDSKLTTSSDVDQYKLLNVEEEPLDSRQKHLDVMCFPVLFSDDRVSTKRGKIIPC